MRVHDTAAGLGLGSVLIYIALKGDADKFVALLKEDAPDIAKAIIAGLILVYIVRLISGRLGDFLEALLGLVTVAAILANAPAVGREIERLFGKK